MDDIIAIKNLILQDIKIGLILNKLLEQFTTMDNNTKSLLKLLTQIHHEDILMTKESDKSTNGDGCFSEQISVV